MNELIQNIKSRKMNAYLVKDRKEALDKALELIPLGSTVGFGGSVTIQEVGIFDNLENCNLLDKTNEDFHYRCLTSDVYLSSANAIINDGRIVNVDGRSNRVAAISFGPKKVIIIIGKNKIVSDYNMALERVRNVCIPKNLERLRNAGKNDWTADNMWCNISIIERQRDPNRIHVIIVDEELGY